MVPLLHKRFYIINRGSRDRKNQHTTADLLNKAFSPVCVAFCLVGFWKRMATGGRVVIFSEGGKIEALEIISKTCPKNLIHLIRNIKK